MFDFFSSFAPAMTIPADTLSEIRQRFSENWLQLQEQAQQGTLPPIHDRRFQDQAWTSHPAYLALAHSYLLGSKTLNELIEATQASEPVRERLRFSAMQWIEAMSPGNFLLTNPQAQQKAIQTQGQSLSQGIGMLLEDLQKGRMLQTDESAFEVGVNVAITPGKVVAENPLFQLIQYAPQTESVFQRPLLLVPPNINKYYILDLQEKNSFVRYVVEQGFTVFLISWRNPLPDDTDFIEQASWGDYLQYGVLAAIDVVRAISGQDQINTLGFCVGGTLLSSALALAQAQGRQPAYSLTLLTTLLDFTHTGVLDVFVDEAHAQMRDLQLGAGGLMTAKELASTFSFLRPGELVWNYVSSRYLMGETPAAFDLLYWNSDGTNLAGPFFAWYFRNTYLENRLCKPGNIQIDGHALHLQQLAMPAYIYGSREDHIVPWLGAYDSMHVLSGPRRFVMGASGHIAGVINHPQRKRRSHWLPASNTAAGASAPQAQEWLAQASEQEGSWWPDWIHWLSAYAGNQVPAPKVLGSQQFIPIEPAPGRYVKVSAV